MVAKVTLERYIKKLDSVIESRDPSVAKDLQKEILVALGSQLDGLKNGLTNYGFVALYSDRRTGKTAKAGGNVDYIKDAHLLKSRLLAELEKVESDLTEMQEKTGKSHKLFISHSSKDADYIEVLVSLFETLGLREDEIICSSIPPYCIPLDKKVYDWLVNEFQRSDLHMVFALSCNYYESAACLNEMGAAWAMKHSWTGILMPGFDFAEIRGCIDTTQISIKLDDKDQRTLNYRLDELKNNLTSEFDLRPMSPTVWERKREDFLNRITEIAKKRMIETVESEESEEFQLVIGKNDVGNIPIESAFLLVYAAADEGVISRLEVDNAPPFVTVQGKQFMSDMSHRESARWQEALDMLISWGWVKSQADKNNVYELTGTGYKKAEWLKEGMGIDTDREPLEELKDFEA